MTSIDDNTNIEDIRVNDEAIMKIQEFMNAEFQEEGKQRLYFTSSIQRFFASTTFAFYIDENYTQTPLGLQAYDLKICDSAVKLGYALKELNDVSSHRHYLVYLRVTSVNDTDQKLTIFEIHAFVAKCNEEGEEELY